MMARFCAECYVQAACDESCAVDVTCTVCDRRKHRIGRSEPEGAWLCDDTCLGYLLDPEPPHLWPSEWAEHAAGHPRELDDDERHARAGHREGTQP